MKANVTVTVSHDGTAKVLVATVGDIADLAQLASQMVPIGHVYYFKKTAEGGVPC